MSLNASDIPDLFTFKDEKNRDVTMPIETLRGTDKTAYLEIDLNVDAMGGQDVHKMTAVFAPDPSKLSGEVDILLWFHGDKHYWSQHPKVDKYFNGKSIHYYLNEPVLALTKLREFILKSSKRQFVLVAPTLNDNTGNGPKHTAGGLLWQQADAEAYLQQVLNGVKKHLGGKSRSQEISY
jgi:hypothetical protein